jgi:hypothetical protein
LAAKDAKNDRRQVELMLALPHCGEHARAAAIADKLRTGAPDAEILCEVARGYALCARSAGGDAKLSGGYAAKALDALREAAGRGYKDAVSIETDPDLDAIRSLPGYAAVLDQLNPGAKANGKAAGP